MIRWRGVACVRRVWAEGHTGALFEENVHAAADYVNATSVEEVIALIREAGFTPAQRTTLYEILKVYE